MALGFGADCIKIVVSMATDRSHRLTMGKTKPEDQWSCKRSPESAAYTNKHV